MATKINYDPKKLRELVLYVAAKSANTKHFGATKLNKILFFSDFLSYGLLGHAITGATYQKERRGPVARQLPAISRDIERDGDGVFVEELLFQYKQTRLVPKRHAELSFFTADEIDMVDRVIDALSSQTAGEVSLLSHERSAGWKAADIGCEIPYETVFLSTEPATKSDIEKGKELARKYGWLQNSHAV
jgi:Protein of unknown function (DUF4065)